MKTPSKLILLSLALQACTSEPDPPPATARATYTKDVAPLLAERCVSCHRPEGIAPFALDTYEVVKLMARPSLDAVKARIMPPWLVVADGSCRTFEDSRWLSVEEMATLETWIEDGMVEGDPVSPIEGTTEETLGEGAVELGMSVPYLPASSAEHPSDDYRCFSIDPALDRDRFITAFEVLPGDPTQVHHVLVYDVDPSMVVGGGPTGPITNADVMASLQGDGNGWSCFGAAGEGVVPFGLPVAWAPGVGITRYTEGTGLWLPKGHLLVMQIHYHLHAADRQDRTKMKLELIDQVAEPGFMLLPDGFLATAFGPQPDSLAPGMSDVPYTWNVGAVDALNAIRGAIGAPNAEVRLRGIVPHMHGRGVKMSASLTKEGSPASCLADVFRWDFDWQRFYFYRDPILLEADQTLSVTCHFDTSNDTAPVLPGLGSNDEMCLFGIYVTAKP